MLKVAFITLHRVRNYGSSLQTLALQKQLERMGCQVEVIDYYPERYSSLGLLKRLKHKNRHFEKNFILLFLARVAISFSYLRKKLVFDSFLKKHIKLSNKTYHSEQELKTDYPQADLYLTGSDQVWNSHWNEGIDLPFYLSFLPGNAMRASYAASIGNAEISEQEKQEISPYLERFLFLSAREDTGKHVLRNMGFTKACQVLDPTLLLTREEWEPYVSNRYQNRKYVVTYNLHHDPEIDRYANQLAKEENLEVYHISYNWHDVIKKGKLKWCPTVEEYLGLIKYAQYVVTDSFHATVFSLCFEKKFVAIYPQEAGNRIFSLLTLTRLTDRGITGFKDTSDIKEKIDYDEVQEKLCDARKFSEEYLSVLIRFAEKKENEKSQTLDSDVDNISAGKCMNVLFEKFPEQDRTSVPEEVLHENTNKRTLYHSKQDCCGCQACVSICPAGAIQMEEDSRGYFYPVVNEDKCVNCGLCKKVCAYQYKQEECTQGKTYVAMALDEEVLLNSASGGIFASLASEVISKDGVVFGAAYGENFCVHHVEATSVGELRCLQGSKYVQSSTSGCFRVVKSRLEEGKKVLFSGTPCQVAGLKGFLQKDYANLYTVDIICHGVPSNRLFGDFITWLGSHFGGKVKDFKFRDKRNGWGLNGTATVEKDGIEKRKTIYGSEYAYYYYFLNADLYRENCYNCPYAGKHRPGDMTIGDYWGIESAHPELLKRKEWKEDKGLSVIICNTQKGEELRAMMQESIRQYPSTWENAARKNTQLCHPSEKTIRREQVLSLYENGGYEAVEARYCTKMGWRRYSNRIKRLIPTVVKRELKKIKK